MHGLTSYLSARSLGHSLCAEAFSKFHSEVPNFLGFVRPGFARNKVFFSKRRCQVILKHTTKISAKLVFSKHPLLPKKHPLPYEKHPLSSKQTPSFFWCCFQCLKRGSAKQSSNPSGFGEKIFRKLPFKPGGFGETGPNPSFK